MQRPSLTVGIEEEFQVIDPESRELRSHVALIFSQEKGPLSGKLKKELHQPVVEVGTNVCRNIAEAKTEIIAQRSSLAALARENGLRIAAAGTHPFTHWGNVAISAGNQRYERLISDLQMVARANLIFGLHVHVGVEDREMQIAIMNQARYFLPHILALSVNSPFWLGRDTGWMSYRCKVFDKFPRTNIPDFFTGWAEYQEFVELLVKTNCIIDGGQIWWDVRPHHLYGTLEYRICDIPLRAEETVTIAALFQAITAKLWLLRAKNLTFRPYRRSLIMENKWRAARWGIRGLLIDFGKQTEVPYTDLLSELLEFIDDVVDDLGTRQQIQYVRTIVEQGTGAERQLAVYRATNDLRAVMDYVAAETEHGLPRAGPLGATGHLVDANLRAIFNANYSDAVYARVCALMEQRLEEPEYGFRIAETPLFVPDDLRPKLEACAREILELLLDPAVIAAGRTAVPERFHAPGDDALPQCVAIDLAIVRGEDGSLAPRLIELQAFPSLYAMQLLQAEIWSEVLASMPGMPTRFTPLFMGSDRAAYIDLLRRTVVADADVDAVVLLDLHPEEQKTRPDFHGTRQLLGVRSVDAKTLRREGRKLLAPKDGRMVEVARVYNRIVFDELEKRAVKLPFDWRDDLDVTWVCHPNWYWIWSKHSLPRIHHPCAPKTWLLSDFDDIPVDCSNYILKPLFSFAGTGVNPDLTPEALRAIPDDEREQWILQERVDYAPALIAPDGTGVKAEMRMLFLKPDDAKDYTLAINMVRLSRGKIHGVDHNKGLQWVGSSVGVWPA